MATERQILANQRNSLLSKGPTSPAGRSRSKLNSTKHGMAAELAEVEAGLSPEFQQRRARWAAEQQPVGEAGNFALDRVVAATFLIERCERAVNNVITSVQQRAKHTWDQDRAIEAATILGRLAKNPVLASCQLQATLAGVMLLIEVWLKLGVGLEDTDWTESERSKALDLLGVAPDLRSGLTPVDSDGTDSVDFRRALVLEEVDRLKAFRDEALTPIDTLERQHAMQGDVALLSKPAKLLMRYERDAWRHYDESMKKVQASRAEQEAVAPAPTVAVVEPPRVREKPVAPKESSFEAERRALLAEAAPFVKPVIDQLVAEGFVGEDAWLAELERQIASYNPLPGSYVPIAAGSRNSR